MSMRDYLTLHLDVNKFKGAACNKKGYGCKSILKTIQRYTKTQIQVKEQPFYCCSAFQAQYGRQP